MNKAPLLFGGALSIYQSCIPKKILVRITEASHVPLINYFIRKLNSFM